MGYNIGIGQAKLEYEKYDDKEAYINITVEHVKNENAPNFGFGDISGFGNHRYPSYTGMSYFYKTVGLEEIFMELLSEHTYIKEIVPMHLNIIKEARIKWENTHKDCKNKLPNYKNEPENFRELNYKKQDEITKEFDWMYARLIWFEFWFKWALDNCSMPCMYNS